MTNIKRYSNQFRENYKKGQTKHTDKKNGSLHYYLVQSSVCSQVFDKSMSKVEKSNILHQKELDRTVKAR
jgi:hypothetical protein